MFRRLCRNLPEGRQGPRGPSATPTGTVRRCCSRGRAHPSPSWAPGHGGLSPDQRMSHCTFLPRLRESTGNILSLATFVFSRHRSGCGEASWSVGGPPWASLPTLVGPSSAPPTHQEELGLSNHRPPQSRECAPRSRAREASAGSSPSG